MTMIRITTETGSVYDIQESRGIAAKHGFPFKYGILKATPDWRPAYDASRSVGERFIAHDWVDEHGLDRIPEVGECLYISGLREWYLSTRVVRVEEVEDEY